MRKKHKTINKDIKVKKEEVLNNLGLKRALTLSEAAQYACVSRGIIKNWLESGALPYEVLPSSGEGKHCFQRIRKDDLDEFLNKHYCEPDKNFKKESDDELILLPNKS